jgi:hypothetical protein
MEIRKPGGRAEISAPDHEVVDARDKHNVSKRSELSFTRPMMESTPNLLESTAAFVTGSRVH